jgi:lysophospholipase L1-like esterase
MKTLCALLLLGCSLGISASVHAAEKFELRDGDRVVLVGSTLIEREQRYGYWETALTRRYPDKSITFRNLGWSGDTVFGDARAGFGSQADGFRHLKEHVLALKPTVIFIGYGTNESFAGAKGLPHFIKGLETLLDAFAPTKALIVLLSPLKQENLGPPLPDPTANNKNLRLYADAIRDVAKKRGYTFVDLYDLLARASKPHTSIWLTDNGIHLTEFGYELSTVILEWALNLSEKEWKWKVEIDVQGKVGPVQGARIEKIAVKPLRFRVKTDRLGDGGTLLVKGLMPGKYTLSIDGKDAGGTADEKDFAVGVRVYIPSDLAQSERLRQAIIAKNRLYFYRWRPENETYLFGFRKHEQGQNAREIPQFDPLIVEKEKEIAKLRVPVPHTYELKAEKKP